MSIVPNFNISDVMFNYFDGCDPDDLDILIDYRTYHPKKFASTLRWTYGEDSDEYHILRSLTSKGNDGISFVPERLSNGVRSKKWFFVYSYKMRIGRIAKYKTGRGWWAFTRREWEFAVDTHRYPLKKSLADTKKEAGEWLLNIKNIIMGESNAD